MPRLSKNNIVPFQPVRAPLPQTLQRSNDKPKLMQDSKLQQFPSQYINGHIEHNKLPIEQLAQFQAPAVFEMERIQPAFKVHMVSAATQENCWQI